MSFNKSDKRDRSADRRGSSGFKGRDNNYSYREQNIKTKIEQVLNNNNTRKNIQNAKEVAQDSSGKNGVKTNQIRRIYGPVVKIQAQLSSKDKVSNKWERELSMLKPRVVYAAAREAKLNKLRDYIIAFIEAIEETSSDSKKQEWTQHFCNFMEAVVAYHKKYEKSPKSSGQSHQFHRKGGGHKRSEK